MRDAISNTDDIIDSRDVISRIEDLESEIDDTVHEFDKELCALKSLAEEGEFVPDWEDGATLIRHDYFVTYAQELAEDIGATSSDNSWPIYCIDWDMAARELQHDYVSLGFDGVEYWARV